MEGDLRPEYDFSGAVRGKHYHPLHKGYTITIHKADLIALMAQFPKKPKGCSFQSYVFVIYLLRRLQSWVVTCLTS